MKMIEVYNNLKQDESIRLDQIESVCRSSSRVNDFGSIRLLSGRVIYFGCSGEAEKVIKAIEGESQKKGRLDTIEEFRTSLDKIGR